MTDQNSDDPPSKRIKIESPGQSGGNSVELNLWDFASELPDDLVGGPKPQAPASSAPSAMSSTGGPMPNGTASLGNPGSSASAMGNRVGGASQPKSMPNTDPAKHTNLSALLASDSSSPHNTYKDITGSGSGTGQAAVMKSGNAMGAGSINSMMHPGNAGHQRTMPMSYSGTPPYSSMASASQQQSVYSRGNGGIGTGFNSGGSLGGPGKPMGVGGAGMVGNSGSMMQSQQGNPMPMNNMPQMGMNSSGLPPQNMMGVGGGMSGHQHHMGLGPHHQQQGMRPGNTGAMNGPSGRSPGMGSPGLGNTGSPAAGMVVGPQGNRPPSTHNAIGGMGLQGPQGHMQQSHHQSPAQPSGLSNGPSMGGAGAATGNQGGMAPSGGGGGAGAPMPNGADPEKRKLIQQQLVLLLHAHKCQRREKTNGEIVCKLPHCTTMKGVLQHMTTCNAGKNCPIPHCASSRQIISHWRNCSRNDCPVCLPLKERSNSQGILSSLAFHNNSGGIFRNNLTTGPSLRDAANSLPQGPTGAAGAPHSQLPSGAQGPGLLSAADSKMTPANPGAGNGMQRIYDALGLEYETGRPAMGGPPAQQQQHSMQQTAGNLGLTADKYRDGGAGPRGSGPGNMGPGLPGQGPQLPSQASLSMGGPGVDMLSHSIQAVPQPPASAKAWHADVTDDLRNHLVQKLVQAIFPAPDPNALKDKRMNHLVHYARKVESEMYNQANKRDEYYHLLAEKIYKIQKELEEKRIARKGQAGGGVGPQGLTNGPTNRLRPPSVGDPMAMNRMPPAGNMQPQQQNIMPSGYHGVPGNNSIISPPPVPMGPQGGGSQVQSMNPGSVSSVGVMSPRYDDMRMRQGQPPQQQRFDMRQMEQPPMSNQSMVDLQQTGPASMKEVKQEPSAVTPVGADMMDLGAMPGSNGLPSVGTVGPASSAALAPEEGPSAAGSSMVKQEPADDKAEVKKEIKREVKEEPSMPIPTPKAPVTPVSAANSTVDTKTSMGSMPTGILPVVHKPPPNPKVFSDEEIRVALMPIIERLYKQEPEGAPFRLPVDPQALGIPDYPQIVSKPMDLTTIKRKLESGQYETPWDCVSDVWLMFDNAWSYNRKVSRVYKFCSKLSEVFEMEVDGVMKSLGYCCGRKFFFNPQVLCCYGKKLCTIGRDAVYYSYQNRYVYCLKCFEEHQGDEFEIADDSPSPMLKVKKSEFKKTKNDVQEPEPFCNCNECGRKFHNICVMHLEEVSPEGYTCTACVKAKGQKTRDNRFSAKRLQPTELGNYLEKRVNNYLKKKDCGAGDVTIRVVSQVEKNTEVPSKILEYFPNIPSRFPHRSKAMFAFQEIDGADVCFFGMHVQEYDDKCPAPNASRVYISYLDSVHFFHPRQHRTAVYHEILIGYFHYARQQGYKYGHIWACPPCEGDDYIFHAHPPEQKNPKPKRLQDWYKKMLDRAILEGVVKEYKDIYKDAVSNDFKDVSQLPLFDGDFWINVLSETVQEEESIKKKEEEEMMKEAAMQGDANESDGGDDSMDGSSARNKQSDKKRGKGQKKKNNKSKMAKNKNKKAPQAGESTVWSKVFAALEKHRDVFFVIQLQNSNPLSDGLMPVIREVDQPMQCDLMDMRDAFLTTCREKHWEFSSLRRSKYSTLAFLHEIHQEKFSCTCNSCKGQVETGYHCSECEDFDLCVPCYEKEGHNHTMSKFGLNMDTDMGGNSSNTPTSKRDSVQKCIRSLVHACSCRDANCKLPNCQKMKRVVAHTTQCQRRAEGACPLCKQLMALCCYHARNCCEANCKVPICSNIKAKLKQQADQARLNHTLMLRRRMQATKGQNRTAAASSSSASYGQTSSGSSGPSSKTARSAPSPPASYGTGKPGVGNPPAGARRAAEDVMEVANSQVMGPTLQVQRGSTAAMSRGPGSVPPAGKPQVPSSFSQASHMSMGQQQQQQSHGVQRMPMGPAGSHQGPGTPGSTMMENPSATNWSLTNPMQAQQQQQAQSQGPPHQQQQQQAQPPTYSSSQAMAMTAGGAMTQSGGSYASTGAAGLQSVAGVGVTGSSPQPGGGGHNEAVSQLLNALKQPQSPQQQQQLLQILKNSTIDSTLYALKQLQSPQRLQVLRILKSNPPLMAAFIRQRNRNGQAGNLTALMQQQQQQQRMVAPRASQPPMNQAWSGQMQPRSRMPVMQQSGVAQYGGHSAHSMQAPSYNMANHHPQAGPQTPGMHHQRMYAHHPQMGGGGYPEQQYMGQQGHVQQPGPMMHHGGGPMGGSAQARMPQAMGHHPMSAAGQQGAMMQGHGANQPGMMQGNQQMGGMQVPQQARHPGMAPLHQQVQSPGGQPMPSPRSHQPSPRSHQPSPHHQGLVQQQQHPGQPGAPEQQDQVLLNQLAHPASGPGTMQQQPAGQPGQGPPHGMHVNTSVAAANQQFDQVPPDGSMTPQDQLARFVDGL